MNKEYKIKLDLNKKLYNKKMAFNQFDENVNDFYIEVTKNNKVVKDLDKSIITLVAIKPNSEVDAQFIEVKEGQIYADLKPSMCDLVGNYQAKAMIVLEGEIVTTDTINYSVNEDKIISRLNDDIVSDERFTLFTDALARLSTIEISEEQRMINEAERILSEENRKIEEAKRVEAELIRQHEEADRTKYDAIRESNENIRKQNESIRLANETNRIDEEAKRVEEENKRKLAEEERNANYNFMTEDEERRRSEANAHKEAEVLRVQSETNRVNEEAKRRTTEQSRVSAENTRVSNENTREANETTRQSNETKRVEAETQRQNRYNSFIADAEANANEFENYTNTAKVKEEERRSNELERKSQETQRVSNENERLANEETRKANEVVREENETSRQNVFENKVNEVDEKIVELNTTKDNFISSINTKVDNKISELDSAKSDMTNTVTNKIDEVENRFNALTSKQQQDAEVIDARDGETSLKARLDRDIEKAKQVYVNVEGSNISTDSSVGYAKDVEILGNTIQDASNLADIRSVGDKVEGQELYEIPVLSVGGNLFNINSEYEDNLFYFYNTGNKVNDTSRRSYIVSVKEGMSVKYINSKDIHVTYYTKDGIYISGEVAGDSRVRVVPKGTYFAKFGVRKDVGYEYDKLCVCESSFANDYYEPYQEDKLTILSPVQLEKVGDVADRIICKDGIWGVEKNVGSIILENVTLKYNSNSMDFRGFKLDNLDVTLSQDVSKHNYINSVYECNSINENNNKLKDGIILYLHSSTNKEVIVRDSSTTDASIVNSRLEKSIFKYIKAQPQFIPLPHDQQIKLRTFANKTSISFLTEIEGTIKAQVPKSLGATVNTHTEQISNLNKELDRVKKLEESTVSTVETESDFTTVEATSNGYFEDVKLEGKTLVNLAKSNSNTYSYRTNLDNGWIKFDATNNTGYKFDPVYNYISIMKPSTTYTIIIEVRNNTCVGNLEFNYSGLNGVSNGVCINKDIILSEGFTGSYIISCISKEDVYNQRLIISPRLTPYNTNGSFTFRTILLEGDHTQNPPSYFEGLKSVGDGADEIVVSSCNNKNLFNKASWNNQKKTYIKLKPNTQYTVSCTYDNPGDKFAGFYGILTDINGNVLLKNGSFVFHYNLLDVTYKNTFITDSTGVVILDVTGYNFIESYKSHINIQIEEGSEATSYVEGQSDKKRLLYYNNETQTWEKPILREWDSIEKHADGKYYYHQRSGEVVLNGSENWENWVTWGDDVAKFKLTYTGNMMMVNDAYTRTTALCDRFNAYSANEIGKLNDIIRNIEGFGLGYSPYKEFLICIAKTKLVTQDIAGFKTWLNANPTTIVFQLAQEKVYECTNIDLLTYANETNYIVVSGAIAPKSTLKVHNNISNVVSLLQKKVSLLESNITSYMITQNRLMLASRYNADTVSFKVDVASLRNSFEYDNDLYELILNNILVGKDNYNREYIENLIIFYWMDFVISDEMHSTLFGIIEEQHNPKIVEEAPLI